MVPLPSSPYAMPAMAMCLGCTFPPVPDAYALLPGRRFGKTPVTDEHVTAVVLPVSPAGLGESLSQRAFVVSALIPATAAAFDNPLHPGWPTLLHHRSLKALSSAGVAGHRDQPARRVAVNALGSFRQRHQRVLDGTDRQVVCYSHIGVVTVFQSPSTDRLGPWRLRPVPTRK